MNQYGDATPADRPLIIPIFIPHVGCPHQCLFCSQHTITGKATVIPTRDQIQQEVRQFLDYGRRPPSTTEISFYGGNFLGLEQPTIRSLLETAMRFVQAKKVDRIRFSTRPDTVNEHTLDLLAGYPVSTVELGVQSMNDRVLEIAGRGHRAADTVAAARLLKERGYQLGLQMMVGLPRDNDDGALQTARRMIALQPDFVRIYPTLVLKDSPLAGWFNSGRYLPMPLATCVSLVKRLYLLFKTHLVPVVRMGLQASDGLMDGGNLLAGPYHPAFGHLVHGEIALDAISSVLEKMETRPNPLTITTHPSMVSRVQGLNRRNIRHLQHAFELKKIIIHQDRHMAKAQLMVDNQRVVLP